MRSLNAFANEDTNQFGPGTDLMVSLLALVLVMTVIASHLYSQEKDKNAREGGNFRLAAQSFPAADFHARPVTKLVNQGRTEARVKEIVQDYRQSEQELGISSSSDTPARSTIRQPRTRAATPDCSGTGTTPRDAPR
jgi:hypothetical protein